LVQEASDLGPIHYFRQGEAKGLGHAVLCGQQHVGEDPFAVLLGDDLIDEAETLLTS
jgi:UTP--glucose-1-phosphate uridylyltransferase